MAQQGKKYYLFAAYAQAISIILVVLIHSFHEYPDGNNGFSFIVVRMMYTINVLPFIFISGFLLGTTTLAGAGKFSKTASDINSISTGRKYSPGKFLMKKCRRLLVPYIVLTLVTFVPRAYLSGMADSEMTLSWESFVDGFLYKDSMPIPFMWYIQAVFILLMLVYLLVLVGDKLRLTLTQTAASMALIFIILPLTGVSDIALFSFGAAMKVGIFMVLGVFYAWWKERIDRIVKWNSWSVFGLFVLAWFVSFFVTEGSEWLTLCSLLGVAAIISLSCIMAARNIRILDKIVGANYLIFLLSWYANILCQQVLAHYAQLPWYVHTILSLTAGIVIPTIAYNYLERHQQSRWVRVASVLLGQTFRKQK